MAAAAVHAALVKIGDLIKLVQLLTPNNKSFEIFFCYWKGCLPSAALPKVCQIDQGQWGLSLGTFNWDIEPGHWSWTFYLHITLSLSLDTKFILVYWIKVLFDYESRFPQHQEFLLNICINIYMAMLKNIEFLNPKIEMLRKIKILIVKIRMFIINKDIW